MPKSEMENFTNYSECHFLDSPSDKKLFLFFNLTIITTAIPSNIFSLYVAWQHIRQKNELGVYLFNLALSDLIFTIGLSLRLDYLWRGVWIHGGHTCLLSAHILFTNFYASAAFLCCIAVDRYLAVVHPFKYTCLKRVGTAAAVSAAIWVLIVCFNATVITWEDSYNRELFCSNAFFVPASVDRIRVYAVRFLVGFVVPFLLVVFSTWGISEAVKSNQATEEQERKQIMKQLTVILLCLLLCFGPIHVFLFLRTLVESCKDSEWFLYVKKISMLLSCLNCVVDPFLYCFITKAGKASVHQVALFLQVKKRSKDEDVV